ncbi:MAG: hypothetical protein NVSMB14_14310 [Isosphaeraceae bacterium]
MTTHKPTADRKLRRDTTKTVAGQWRFKRNITIYVANKAGLSQRFLADVFGLPRSNIGIIIQNLRKLECQRTPKVKPQEIPSLKSWTERQAYFRRDACGSSEERASA